MCGWGWWGKRAERGGASQICWGEVCGCGGVVVLCGEGRERQEGEEVGSWCDGR